MEPNLYTCYKDRIPSIKLVVDPEVEFLTLSKHLFDNSDVSRATGPEKHFRRRQSRQLLEKSEVLLALKQRAVKNYIVDYLKPLEQGPQSSGAQYRSRQNQLAQ
jgi:hypothetical protein